MEPSPGSSREGAPSRRRSIGKGRDGGEQGELRKLQTLEPTQPGSADCKEAESRSHHQNQSREALRDLGLLFNPKMEKLGV